MLHAIMIRPLYIIKYAEALNNCFKLHNMYLHESYYMTVQKFKMEA